VTSRALAFAIDNMKAGQKKEILSAIFRVVYGYDCHEHAAWGHFRTDVYHSSEYTKDLQIPDASQVMAIGATSSGVPKPDKFNDEPVDLLLKFHRSAARLHYINAWM
jgi:hypothetical protein